MLFDGARRKITNLLIKLEIGDESRVNSFTWCAKTTTDGKRFL